MSSRLTGAPSRKCRAATVPSTSVSHTSRELATNLAVLLNWAKNPYFKRVNFAFCLISEKLSDLHDALVRSGHTSKLELAFPDLQQRLAFIGEAFNYLNEITDDRRRNPRDDLSTVLANATLGGGEPVPQFELFSLYFLVMVAGHDTTRNAISSGLMAFLEHPDQLEKLKRDPSLVDRAADEIVRWTTPVNHFSRTATRDYELRGKTIRKGQSLCLFYPSANRDEEVFDDPFAFRIDRRPNPHIAFGMGEHVCLGAHLARLELRHAFGQLRERLESCEATRPVDRVLSGFVGGIKRAPMRWSWRPIGSA